MKKKKVNDITYDKLALLINDFKKEFGDLYSKYQEELNMSNSKASDMIILNNFFNEFQDVANDEKWFAIFEDSEAATMPMPESVQCQFVDKLFKIKNLDVLEELDIDESPWFTGYIDKSQIPYFKDILSGHFVDSKPKKVKDEEMVEELKDEMTEQEREEVFFSPNYKDDKSIIELKLDLLRFFNSNNIKNYVLANNNALANSGDPDLEDLADESNAIEQASYEYFKENYNEAFNSLVKSFDDWKHEVLQDLLEDLSLEGIITVNKDIYPDSVRKVALVLPVTKEGELIGYKKTGEYNNVDNNNPKANIGVVYNIPVDAADKYQAKHLNELRANQKRRELVRRTK